MTFSLLEVVKYPLARLHALNDDYTLKMDLTPFFQSGEGAFSDNLESNRATFTLVNTAGIFDKFGGAYADVLKEGTFIRWEVGYHDIAASVDHWYPAFFGKVGAATGTYARDTDETFVFTAFDLMRQPLSQHVTTRQWTNTQYNLIALDVLSQYTKYTASDLYALDYPSGNDATIVQFPDFSVADIWKMLFDVALYFVWFDYEGQLATRPRIGSMNSAAPGLLGYPDATVAPDPSIVDFVFPDATLIESIAPDWADFDFINQVKVLGRGLVSQVSLGPSQLLVNLNTHGDEGFLSSGDGFTKRLSFSDQTGNDNAITAQNVYAKIWTPSHEGSGGTEPFYLVINAGALNPDTGVALPVGPFQDGTPSGQAGVKIQKSTGQQEGGIRMTSQTPQYVDIFGYANSDGGGFLYAIEIWGQPLITTAQELTAIVDYNPATVTAETLTDAFGDHQTFQASHNPIAKGTPVSVTVNVGAGDASIGTVSADQVYTSDQFKVDFERGRIVLRNPSYRSFSADTAYTGGTAVSNTHTIDTTHAVNVADASIYNTYRRCAQGSSSQFSYLLTGLDLGRGYNLRLHFSDTSSTASGQRKFNIYVNSGKVADSLDVYQSANGKDRAYVLEIDGTAPDINGHLLIEFRSESLPGEPFCCGIELLLPQGQGASPFSINCGGAAFAPSTIPVVKATYAYSPVQETYGIQNTEINNPLLQTIEQATATGQYTLNYSAWSRNRFTIVTACVPTLAPTKVIKFFNPQVGANGSDFWMYIQNISIRQERPDPDTSDGSCFNNTIFGYVLYVEAR